MEGVSSWIAELVASGLAEDEIAVLVRTEALLRELSGSWLADFPKLNWLSMPAAKGSEFQAVAVVSLDQSVLPDEERLLAAKDESQLDEVMATERHLLYVAATRARDHLWLSGMDPVSEFVTDLMGRVGPSKS
jgi:superfamily I DNA/RNA helicase